MIKNAAQCVEIHQKQQMFQSEQLSYKSNNVISIDQQILRHPSISHLDMLEVHPLELLDHPIRVCPIPCSHLPGKLIKSLVILLLLPGPPPWPAGDGLQAPVSGEGVVQQVEAVPGYIHLIHLQN